MGGFLRGPFAHLTSLHLRLEHGAMGAITDTAAELAWVAQAMGMTCVLQINGGVDMMAVPGMTGEEVHASWKTLAAIAERADTAKALAAIARAAGPSGSTDTPAKTRQRGCLRCGAIYFDDDMTFCPSCDRETVSPPRAADRVYRARMKEQAELARGAELPCAPSVCPDCDHVLHVGTSGGSLCWCGCTSGSFNPGDSVENPPSKPDTQVPENTGPAPAQPEAPKTDPFPAPCACTLTEDRCDVASPCGAHVTWATRLHRREIPEVIRSIRDRVVEMCGWGNRLSKTLTDVFDHIEAETRAKS